MRFRELIKKYKWDEVNSTLWKLYPNQRKSVRGYKHVYEELNATKPVKTKMRIVLEDVFDEFDKKYYTGVSGRNGTLNKKNDPEYFKDDEAANRETSYAIEFAPWAEWLGMEVDQATLEEYNDLEIISHCLYEMTFYGFDQKTIKKEIDETEIRIKEVENMTEEERRKRLVPWETVKKKLEKKM